MNVKIAGHDRPVRAPGALPSPIGLLLKQVKMPNGSVCSSALRSG